jgi:hypothetical protein
LSGEGAPDPLVQLKEQELQQRAARDQQLAQNDQQKIGLQAQQLQQRAAETTAKIQSQENIADQKADLTLMRLQQMGVKQNAPQKRQ